MKTVIAIAIFIAANGEMSVVASVVPDSIEVCKAKVEDARKVVLRENRDQLKDVIATCIEYTPSDPV